MDGTRIGFIAADSGEYTVEDTRPVTELEYLTAEPPSKRSLTERRRSQVQLGQEDAWALLLQASRACEMEPLAHIAGTLLLELEQFFYSANALEYTEDVPELTIRDEAMLEEAAKMVGMHEKEIQMGMEAGKTIEHRRSRRCGRKTL
jgi:hypothetical protein